MSPVTRRKYSHYVWPTQFQLAFRQIVLVNKRSKTLSWEASINMSTSRSNSFERGKLESRIELLWNLKIKKGRSNISKEISEA